MNVRIHADVEFPVPNQKTDFKVHLENVECTGDLKKKLQPLLSVAVCDMSVYYKTKVSGQQLEDKERFSNLYVQEGDVFIVEFVSVCSMHTLDEILGRMRTYVRDICSRLCEADHFKGEQMLRDMEVDETWLININDTYQRVLEDLGTCSYELFVPWMCRPTIANRHYFAQEGGLDLLATIYNSSKKRSPFTGDHQDCLSSLFNNKQSEMEIACLLCLWNFSERKEDRRMVLQKFGLDTFIHSLLKDVPGDDHRYDDIIRVKEAATGCLAQYVELPDIQQILAGNKNVLLKFFWLTSNGLDHYQKEVAANTLFCCSNHPKAAAKIIENQFYRLVLEKAGELLSALVDSASLPFTPAVAYFFCLFLANIQTLPEKNLLSNEERQNLDKVFESFLRLVSPLEIGEFQERHNYVWITLRPFLRLALSGPSESLETGDRVTSPAQYNFSPAGKMGLFCLCHLTTTQENRELFREEELVDYLICVRWFAQKCPEVVGLIPNLGGFEQLQPPRLESIAKACLSKCFNINY